MAEQGRQMQGTSYSEVPKQATTVPTATVQDSSKVPVSNPRVPTEHAEPKPTQLKEVSIHDMDSLHEEVSDVVVERDMNASYHEWKVLCKASSESQGWMKSTKYMNLPTLGCLVQVTTQQRNPDGSYAIAEAVTYIPGATF